MKIIVITGTPASGKSTIAGRVARRIGGAAVIRANDLVRSRRLFTSRSPDGTMVADMRKLREAINAEIRRSCSATVIVEGHLLCEIRIRNAMVIVIREHLLTLEKRMKRRGYPEPKIRENIISEAIDYCGFTAKRHYDKVYEIMNSRHAARDVEGLVRETRKGNLDIELLHELARFTKRRGWNA